MHPVARHGRRAMGAAATGRSRSRGAGRSGRGRRHGYRTPGRDSARSWPSIRCASPAGRGPRASPSRARSPTTASTARNRRDGACARRPRRARPRGCRRDRGPRARRSRASTERRTAPRPPRRRIGVARWRCSCPISFCMPSILSVARGCSVGGRQPSAVVSFWYCAAVVSVTRRIASFSGRSGEIPRGPRVDLVVDVGDVAHIGDVRSRHRRGAAGGTAHRRRWPGGHCRYGRSHRPSGRTHTCRTLLAIQGNKVLLGPGQRIVELDLQVRSHVQPKASTGVTRWQRALRNWT